MPAVMQESIALLTSSLGGSSIPTFIIGREAQNKKKIKYKRWHKRFKEKLRKKYNDLIKNDLL